MAIDYPAILSRQFATETISYTANKTMLYALSLGIGADPLDERQLRFVYESNLIALPTLACVLGHRSIKDMDLGIDYSKVVHGDQSLTIHRSLPAAGTVVSSSRVEDVIDRGVGKGALLLLRRSLTDQANGELLAEVRMGILCRGDGGFDASARPVPALPALPERVPDATFEQVTSSQMALLYRLNGDFNPLHADPAIARRAGFERPILHGLATFGIATRAIVWTSCDGDPSRIRSVAGRFSAPVYPGDTLRTDIWCDGSLVSFRTTALGRNAVVLNNGRVELAG
jgi:Acyl dehydratase